MSIIRKIYNYKPIKKHASKILFALKNRPSVDPDEINKDKKAKLLISADFELAWAFRYSKSKVDPIKQAYLARENFPFLLKLFDDYQIPITWATVGHLFLEKCSPNEHDWMKRIPYFENRNWKYSHGDWFDDDPHTFWKNAKAWYAPDLIENILNSNVDHEIASHSFSHIDMTYKNCPREVAEDEIKACVDVAKKWDIELKSFVFPGGTYGNYEVLKKYGIENYRKTIKYELSNPKKDKNDLLCIPVSIGFADNGLGWSKEYMFKRFKSYIDKAILTKTTCHFWFHPSLDKWFLYNIVPDLLKHIAEQRDKGNLDVFTFNELNKNLKNKRVI